MNEKLIKNHFICHKCGAKTYRIDKTGIIIYSHNKCERCNVEMINQKQEILQNSGRNSKL